MGHIRDYIDPKYLSCIDFLDDNGNYQKKTVTITAIKKEESHTGKGKKEPETVNVAYTKETKPIILVTHNMKKITRFSRIIDPEKWVGLRIELYIQENLKCFGELRDVIRVSPKIIKTEPARDYTKQIALLRTAKTLDELKQLFTSLSKSEQSACVAVKDEMKAKLTPNENN